MGSYAGLKTVIFDTPSQVGSIGTGAFGGCVALTAIVLPPSLITLGGYAFENCKALTAIVLPPSLITLGGYMFANSGLSSIYLPKSITTNDLDGPNHHPSFEGTCLENLSGIAAFFQNEVKNEDLIVCECVVQEGTELSECPALMLPSMNPSKLPSNNPSKLPTTMVPTTAAPTTAGPTTAAPTTSAPTPVAPTTAAPSTAAPTTMSPTEVKDACVNLKKRKCRNTCVFSKRQRQCLPKSTSFEHDCAQYEGKTPCLENKVCKFPHGKCVHRCDGKNARRCRKHKFCNLDKVVNPCFGCHLVTACGPRR